MMIPYLFQQSRLPAGENGFEVVLRRVIGAQRVVFPALTCSRATV